MSRCKKAIEAMRHVEECKLLLKKWEIVEELIRVLKVPYTMTIQLQRDDCTLSDLFGYILAIEIGLRKEMANGGLKTTLATVLHLKIQERETKLLENRLMVTAVYLDPRYKCALKDHPEKITLAKLTIELIWERIKKLHESTTPDTCESSPEGLSDIEILLSSVDEYYEKNGFANSTESATNDISFAKTKTEIMAGLDSYDEETKNKRINSTEKVLHFWEEGKTKFPNGNEIFQIVCAVVKIPPTQAAVERVFSASKFIFGDRRCRLRQQLLEDILIIYTNQSIFYEVIKEELMNLEKTL